jgi:putative oxidoreductase
MDQATHSTDKDDPMNAIESPAAPAATRGHGRNIALWAAQILMAALFAFAGINKLFGLQQEVVDQFARIGAGVWFRYFVGAIELVGAVGLLVPRLSAPAAIWLACIMAGAVIAHLTVLPPMAVALVPATLGVVFLLIARGRWSDTFPEAVGPRA